MEKIQLTLEPDKETKRTWRFRAISEDEVVEQVYIAKRAFNGGKVPQRITLTIDDDE